MGEAGTRFFTTKKNGSHLHTGCARGKRRDDPPGIGNARIIGL
jgi:hypothetical protein